MNLLDVAFVAVSVIMMIAGLVMVGAAIRAYIETERRVMIHLSLGFTLIVAATVATVMSVLLLGFERPRRLLMVNNGFSMFGYLFVIYSVMMFE